MRVDRYDAELFSNRSLCWIRLGDGRRALRDAKWCKLLRPKWMEAYFRKAQALMLLKVRLKPLGPAFLIAPLSLIYII